MASLCVSFPNLGQGAGPVIANTGTEPMVEDTPVQQVKGSSTQALDANLNRAQRWRFRQQSKGRGRGRGHMSPTGPLLPNAPEWVGSEINWSLFKKGTQGGEIWVL